MTEIDTRVGATQWQFMTPQLPVRDVREAQAYYRDVFGCKIAWTHREEYGAVYKGRTEIFFTLSTDSFTPSWHFIRVEDADAALADLSARGANVVEEIASHPWGMREFTVEDLNGHCFRIGHSHGPVEARG